MNPTPKLPPGYEVVPFDVDDYQKNPTGETDCGAEPGVEDAAYPEESY